MARSVWETRCSFETRLQRIDGGLGQHELLAAQDVIDVDALHRQHVDIAECCGRQVAEVRIDLVRRR